MDVQITEIGCTKIAYKRRPFDITLRQESQHDGRSLSSLQRKRLAACCTQPIPLRLAKKRKKRNENKEVEADKMLSLSVDAVINTMPLHFCNKMQKLSKEH